MARLNPVSSALFAPRLLPRTDGLPPDPVQAADQSTRHAVVQCVTGLLQPSPVSNDDTVFRLHYKATTALLLVCSLLVASKQYIGDPIDCIVSNTKKDNMQTVMDTYCWIQSTFTVPSRALHKKIGEEIPHPGVVTPWEGDELKHHKYYQWVCFTLLFQAMLFYVPHYLWKMWEGGKCQMLVMDLQSPVMDADTRLEKLSRISDYFQDTLHHHSTYVMQFVCCQILNLLNVVGQMFFTDLFLGYEFTTYGLRVVQFTDMDQEDRPDPMALVFPKMTKCTFHKYGASGTVQRIDGLCVLPINIINEKIYVMLWFWFIILAAVTGLGVLYRLAMLFSPELRRLYLTMRAGLAAHKDVEDVARVCQAGDWFVLCQMGNNMDPIAFKGLIDILASLFKKDRLIAFPGVQNRPGEKALGTTIVNMPS